MKSALFKFATAMTALVASIASAAAESATMGWQADASTASYATQPRMTGPIAQNKYPEKKGVFKGEFLSAWGCQLTAIHKLSLDEKGNLKLKNVSFTILPNQKPEVVETNGIKQ